MKKIVLAAATIAALSTGHQSRAQTVQADPRNYAGRSVICLAKWEKDKLDPAKKEDVKYGRAYFMKSCNLALCKVTAGANCRAASL